jgi:hypothetical protein
VQEHPDVFPYVDTELVVSKLARANFSFRAADADRSGTLSRAEFGAMVSAYDLNEQVRRAFVGLSGPGYFLRSYGWALSRRL